MRRILLISASMLTGLVLLFVSGWVSPVAAQPEHVVKGEILLKMKESHLSPMTAFKREGTPQERKSVQQKRREVLQVRRQGLIELGAQLHKDYKVRILAVYPLTGILRLKVPLGVSVVSLRKKIEEERRQKVEYVVPNLKGELLSHLIVPVPPNPNDRFWSEHVDLGPNNIEVPRLWGLDKIGMQEAWTDTRGGDIVVAVIDSGIDITHPDFTLPDSTTNLWTNDEEFMGLTGQDDGDENCFIDDIRGANMLAFNVVCEQALLPGLHPDLWDKTEPCMYDQTQGDISDENGHGTAMAGIIGGGGNNQIPNDPDTLDEDESERTGVIGVNWNVKLMGIKTFCIETDNINQRKPKMHTDLGSNIRAIEYAIIMRAHIINASWILKKCIPESGATCTSSELAAYEEAVEPLKTAIVRARNDGILFVTGAGNNKENNAVIPRYPANFILDNLITVAATGRNSDKAGHCADLNDKKLDCLWKAGLEGSNYNSNGPLQISAPKVHIAAPGDSVGSDYPPTLPLMPAGLSENGDCSPTPCILPKNKYVVGTGGTSAASSFVAGCAALLQSMRKSLSLPPLAPLDLKNIIMSSGDQPKDAGNTLLLAGKTIEGRRLNCHKAIHMLPVCSNCMGTAGDPPVDVGVSP